MLKKPPKEGPSGLTTAESKGPSEGGVPGVFGTLFNVSEQEAGKSGKTIRNSSRPSRLPLTFSA